MATDYCPMLCLGAFFRLYTRDKPTEFRLERNIDSLKASSFDGKKKTVIVIHGWQGESQCHLTITGSIGLSRA